MDCIILDIDGTLWDTTPIVAKAWGEALKNRTDIAWRPTADNLKKLFGRPMWAIAAAAFPELSPEDQMKLMDECCEHEEEILEKNPGNIFEGVVETIKELSKKYPVCIVSNCEAGYIELVCEKLGITDCIKDGECPGYSGLGKGDNIKRVMERNGYKDIVYVGDTQGDYEATRKAGVPFVFCKYGFGKPEGYEYCVEKFSELLDLF